MSGIFVDPNKTFPISIYYREREDEFGNLECVEVSDEPEDGWEEIVGQFIQPSGSAMSGILENATIINHISTKPVLRTSAMMDGVLLHLMTEWHHILSDGEKDPLPKDPAAIAQIHFNIRQRLFVTYMRKTKMKSVLKNAIQEEVRTGGVSQNASLDS